MLIDNLTTIIPVIKYIFSFQTVVDTTADQVASKKEQQQQAELEKGFTIMLDIKDMCN